MQLPMRLSKGGNDMIIFRCIMLACLLPFTWISSFACRKADFSIRYKRLRGWCLRVLKVCNINMDVYQLGDVPETEPVFFVSNHQATGDPLIIIAGLPTPFTFVSKIENKKIPILSSWAKSIEMIYFDRGDSNSAIHMLRESARYLKRKRNLLIFPEGTRSMGKEMLPFKAGAIKPAYLGKAWIVPITQINSYSLWELMKKGGTLRMVIGKPIPFEEYKKIGMEELSEQLKETIQKNFKDFEKI